MVRGLGVRLVVVARVLSQSVSRLDRRNQVFRRIALLTTLVTLSVSSLATAQPGGAGGAATPPAGQNQGQPQPQTPRFPALSIDLTGPTLQTWSIDQGTYRIVLINAIPGMRYSVRAGGTELAELPVFVMPTGTAPAGLVNPPTPEGAKQCQAALNDVRALITATTESQVPVISQRIRANMTGCAQTDATYITSVLNQTTLETDLEVQMPNDARRTIIVSRQLLEWNTTLSTLTRGKVQTLFGWTFAPNRDEDYFSESTGNNQFTIRRRVEDDGGLTNLPSVFFTWLPTGQAFRNVQHGPTGGIGVTVGSTGARPAFLGGWMVRWNQNLGVVFGAAFYPQRRLDGKYVVDQTITTNLESDQLNRNQLRVNAFFGGVMRFGSDPRKAPTDTGTKPAAPAPAPNPPQK
jgi:hypothetical protein